MKRLTKTRAQLSLFKVKPAILRGCLKSGRDLRGGVVHAVQNPDSKGGLPKDRIALCKAQPGSKSRGWESIGHEEVTCKICLRKLPRL